MKNGKFFSFIKDQSAPSFTQAAEIEDVEFVWDELPVRKIQHQAYVYTGFALDNFTVDSHLLSICSIAHGKFISVFNVSEWKWVNHLEFKDDIVGFIKHKNPGGALYTSCVTKHNWIYFGFLYNNGARQDVIPENWRGTFTEGEFVKIAYDLENSHTAFLLSKTDKGFCLNFLYKNAFTNYDNFIDPKNARVSVFSLKMKDVDQYYVI